MQCPCKLDYWRFMHHCPHRKSFMDPPDLLTTLLLPIGTRLRHQCMFKDRTRKGTSIFNLTSAKTPFLSGLPCLFLPIKKDSVKCMAKCGSSCYMFYEHIKLRKACAQKLVIFTIASKQSEPRNCA